MHDLILKKLLLIHEDLFSLGEILLFTRTV